MESSLRSTSSQMQSSFIKNSEFDLLSGIKNLSNSSSSMKIRSPQKSSLANFIPRLFASPTGFQTPKRRNRDENSPFSDSRRGINHFTFEIPDKRLKKLLLMLRYIFSDIGNLSFYYSMQGNNNFIITTKYNQLNRES